MNKFKMSSLIPLLLATHSIFAQVAINPAQSVLKVKAFRSGMFSALGDNHEILAKLDHGTIDQAKKNVSLLIHAKDLQVLDLNLSPEKRSQVQQRMLGPEVLDVEQFPEIKFESQTVEDKGPNELLVQGTLQLHGKVKVMTLRVSKSRTEYKGATVLRQSDFGIKPVSIAGGMVKVKDELQIEFDIVLLP